MGKFNHAIEQEAGFETEALAIATSLRTPKKIKEFSEMPAEKQNKLVPLINPGHSGESWGYTVSKAMEFAKKGSFEKHPGYATVTQTLKTEKQFSSEATSDKSSDKSNKPSGGLIGS